MSDDSLLARAQHTWAASVGARLAQQAPDADAPASGPAAPSADPIRLHRTPPDLLRRLPRALAEERQWLLLGPAPEGDAWIVAAAAPVAPADQAALQLRLGVPVRIQVVADPAALRDAIAANYAAVVTVEAAPGAPPERIVSLTDTILAHAVEARVSDIHLQPAGDRTVVRWRIDGVLTPATTLPRDQAETVAAYLKTLAGLDYSQRGKPLDGHITRRLAGRDIDFRFSSIGTAEGGDQVVLRVLDRQQGLRRLGDLGFAADQEQAVRRLLAQKHGVILVAGPTGHGKTTTLLAAVGELDAVAQHIVTLEDPVEYRLPHVTQVPVVSDGPGVTFAQGLRAVLRQDPDVIVVGEMRDPETVAIALQAALSGHLVLSSIHAIDAVATCFRLLERGVEPYLLAAALTGVIAQRLVRRVCPACAVPQPVPPAEQAFLVRWAPGRPVPATLPRGRGCNRCQNTGYQGRECLAEILPVTEAVRAAIAAGADAAALQAAATAAGLVPLAAAAADKVLAGRTTVAEAWRVLAATEEAAS